MNRLILVGNGFDLAHGMKTSYNDFIQWYLSYAMATAEEHGKYEDGVISVYRTGNRFINHYCKDIPEYVSYFYNRGSLQPLLEQEMISYDDKTRYSIPYKVTIHSKFLSKLLMNCSFKNWVDIENEYYEFLKELLKQAVNPKRNEQLELLNSSLSVLIKLLEQYLKLQSPNNYHKDYIKIFEQHVIGDEFVHWQQVEKKGLENTLILNFNYTSTIEDYYDPNIEYDVAINYIHGRLGKSDNKLIFGFGDELDESYKNLESDKTRGFFKHIKSFWYFKTRNYHNFLRFLEDGQFQVFILGHSCGLSDRTMLNLIFQHKHCMSIKIFYYEDEQGNTNYTELTEEISRHFTSKIQMRERIVPFPLCKRMPQIR